MTYSFPSIYFIPYLCRIFVCLISMYNILLFWNSAFLLLLLFSMLLLLVCCWFWRLNLFIYFPNRLLFYLSLFSLSFSLFLSFWCGILFFLLVVLFFFSFTFKCALSCRQLCSLSFYFFSSLSSTIVSGPVSVRICTRRVNISIQPFFGSFFFPQISILFTNKY